MSITSLQSARMMRRARPRASGQASVDVLLTIGVAVLAVVATAVYVQRAYQGYVYNNSAAHGSQFDPTSTYTDNNSLNSFAVNQQIDITDQTPPVRARRGLGTCPAGTNCMPSQAGGTVGGEILQTVVKVTSDWNATRQASYDAQ